MAMPGAELERLHRKLYGSPILISRIGDLFANPRRVEKKGTIT